MEKEKQYLEVNQIAKMLQYSPESIRTAIKSYDFLMGLTTKIQKPVTYPFGKVINRWIRVITDPENFIYKFKNKHLFSTDEKDQLGKRLGEWSITTQECFLNRFDCENCFYNRYFTETRENCHMVEHVIKTMEAEGIPDLVIHRYKQKFEEVIVIHIDDQILEAERELNMKKKGYPNWIYLNKITQKLADQRIETQEAIVASLKYFKSNHLKTDRNGQMHLF